MRSIDRPNQYQFAAWAADGSLVHAAPHGAARMDARAARRYQRKWLTWRVQDVQSDRIPRVVRVSVYPIDRRAECRVFDV